MVSHKKIGGMRLTAPSPIRFPKRLSAFNICVADAMKGQKHSSLPKGQGGRHDKAFQNSFKAAVARCRGRGRAAPPAPRY